MGLEASAKWKGLESTLTLFFYYYYFLAQSGVVK